MKKQYYKIRRQPDNDKKIVIRPDADMELDSVFSKIGVPEKKTFSPDAFQLKALDAIRQSDCLVSAPTGSGKTWIAERAAHDIISSNPILADSSTKISDYKPTIADSNITVSDSSSTVLDSNITVSDSSNTVLDSNSTIAAPSLNTQKKKVWYATPLKALTNSIYAQFA
ncbi:MAG: DEAD/DEAH box helicase, partial [Desulfamplus sp.]|nr:DEAD/DEAH box helicase [Desulfamplus sp.]